MESAKHIRKLPGERVQPLYWGVLHGLNDMAAGYLLAAVALTHSYSQSFFYISLYAVLGFGGQLPVGFWLDKRQDIRLAAKVSLATLLLALCVGLMSLETAVILSGIASAFVHVTGGTICLQVHDNKSGPLGLFTAPGVLGLTVGGLMGNAGQLLPLLLIAGVALVGVLIFATALPVYQSHPNKQSELDAHDGIMLTLLLLMCFRSFLFNVVNYMAEYADDGILYIGVGAFLGKFVGGFVADRIGLKRYIYLSLLLALLLLQFGKENIWMLSAGIACLQSSVPLTLLLMSRALPRYPATATAFSLGVSILMAGLPLYLLTDKEGLQHLFVQPWPTGLYFVLFLAAWWLAGRKLFPLTRT